MLRKRRNGSRLSYANVIASLALFVALGGTATAALTLPRDSVGEVQIQADAVRAAEIRADAVRSSEILDDSITLADLTAGARASLDAPRVRVATAEGQRFPMCGLDLTTCTNLASIHVPAGRWLVQAKFSIGGYFGIIDECGLVQSDATVIDKADAIGHGLDAARHGSEQIALLAVLTTAPDVDSTTIAVRCNRPYEIEDLYVSNLVLSAVEVKSAAAE
jgi:hypothetical protein